MFSRWTETPLAQLLGKVGDLIVLNILCAVCCVPIITIGASFSAMYAVLLKQERGETCPLFRTFFASFKGNFLKATAIEGMVLLLGVISAMDILFALDYEGNLRLLFIVVGAIIASVALIIFTLGFTQQSIYENTLKNYLKNSFLIAACAPIQVVLSWAAWALPVVLFILYPQACVNNGFLYIMFGISGPAYITVLLLKGVFSKCESND